MIFLLCFGQHLSSLLLSSASASWKIFFMGLGFAAPSAAIQTIIRRSHEGSRARIIQYSSQLHSGLSMLGHFLDGHASQFSLSGKEIIGVELSEFLFNELFIILRKLQERIKRENGRRTLPRWMLKNFASGNSCTLDRNGKGLITGWKESSSSGTDKEDLH
ncbi:hypothetical protein OIU84_021103 [Salix udensis]|uniref:Uncharacterized protein n=1 Tax=Salix udensis TaxID=889485 RepID=A0AAD6KTX6_9ROSI|nr:hypothetical protein OIU84_021103 [Salix udensis]